MNVVEFVSEHASVDEGGSPLMVNIRVDGLLLAEIMRDVESPMAAKEGHPNLAGSYRAIPKPAAPKDYYAGRHSFEWGESKTKTLLLDCECGCPGCWPLLCRIELTEDEVVWREFEQTHRGRRSKTSFWDYSNFEGFTFRKDQYFAALSALRDDA